VDVILDRPQSGENLFFFWTARRVARWERLGRAAGPSPSIRSSLSEPQPLNAFILRPIGT
jgi:hypothetical protein